MDGIGDQPHDVRGGVRSPLIAVVGSIRPIGSGGGRRRPQKVPVRCRRRHVVVGCYGLGSGAKVGQVGRSVGFKNQIRHEMCWNSIQFNSILLERSGAIVCLAGIISLAGIYARQEGDLARSADERYNKRYAQPQPRNLWATKKMARLFVGTY